MHEDFDQCLRAVRSKDSRFDGWFVTAVITTGIYCRPSCPVVPPRPRNMRFYPSAAAAQDAGYRACKRCRPDASPGSPQWNYRADLVARAMRLISDGVVDRVGVSGLATQLGYSVRQVQRVVVAELGAGPAALARAQRTQTARVMIETTKLAMTDISLAAGFASLRAFNDAIRATFAQTPTQLRESAATGRAQTVAGTLPLRLPFRPPLHLDLFTDVAGHSVPGIEECEEGVYRRSMTLPHGPGILTVLTPPPKATQVEVQLAVQDLRDLAVAISRTRRMLDLDADPVAIDERLAADPYLADCVTSAPGRRVPGAFDATELAVRVLLDDTRRAGRAALARLVETYGKPIDDPSGALTHQFPTAEAIAAADPDALPGPSPSRSALHALATALASGALDLSAGADREDARHQLFDLVHLDGRAIEAIAMRAMRDPDAFDPMDQVVRCGARTLGFAVDDEYIDCHAARWKPWRAYATQHLIHAADRAGCDRPA